MGGAVRSRESGLDTPFGPSTSTRAGGTLQFCQNNPAVSSDFLELLVVLQGAVAFLQRARSIIQEGKTLRLAPGVKRSGETGMA